MDVLFSLLLFFGTFALLLLGFPVAFSLGGSALLFGTLASLAGVFDQSFLQALPERLFGIMNNETLIAVPLFVFMGVMLERSKISEELLDTMAKVLGGLRGGLGISVCLVGGLLAASTGIVGATVVTMGLISLPSMLERKYSPALSTGIICASGTLGQIIPPSIVLIILGDVIASAYQQAQLEMGNFSPDSVSVGDLFVGAIIPGVLLMFFYILYVICLARFKPEAVPMVAKKDRIALTDAAFLGKLLKVLLPPILLIVGVLGSILAGVATPTEAASVGSVGAILLAFFKKQLDFRTLQKSLDRTTRITSMVFVILIGASLFSLVFRGLNGDTFVQSYFNDLPGGVITSFFVVMLIMFIMGFFLDFFEITFVVVPMVAPILLQMGLNPIWLGVMIALNLQTSFLTPPFGFSLFYIRGVTPPSVSTETIYRGALPFIGIQLFLLTLLWFFPEMTTILPKLIFGTDLGH